ncbi:MAG: TnpV protein [Oscillospiraceae bacterium]|nr:TnpV protein [Oscillospiraceae bacterium]
MSKLEYIPVGDYLLPNIILSDPPPDMVEPLGRYGRMHKAFLREHRPILYNTLLLSERLYPLCREIDEAAATRLATIPNRDIAHEVILAELVYC